MVKIDIFTGHEPNLEMPLENRPFQNARTSNIYNGIRTVRGNGYGTRPGDGEDI
jgi:hypothetical protein